MKRLLFFALAFGILGSGANLHAQGYLRKANKQYELGAFAAAIPGLARAVEKHSDDLQTLEKLARAQRMTGRLEAATNSFTLLADQSDDPAHQYLLALTLVEQGKYSEALNPLSRAASQNESRAAALAERIAYAQANDDKQSAWRVSNEFANSSADDFVPAVFGDFVVYASTRVEGQQKLYLSSRDNNNFLTVPRALHKVLTEQQNDAPVAYSPSGELVAFTRNNFDAGQKFTPEAGWELSLIFAYANAEGDFQQGKPFVHNGPGFSTAFACFSPDGKRLYFSSDRPGGEGGFDLYSSDRTTSGWATPINLGPSINSPGNELLPHAAGASLYFSSDYWPGYGGLDIYRADLLGSDVTGVVNLGKGINSAADDAGFTTTADGQLGYFFSNRVGGKGGLDLYRAVRNGKALTLAVVDGASKEPISMALLDFSDCGQGNFLTGVDGQYTFRALETMNCRPTVRKAGYNTKEFSINASALRDNARLEIVLNPEDRMTIYEGKVLHSRTGDALAGVRIIAQQEGSSYQYETRSFADGRYELKLEREQDYLVSYAQPGMADIDREVSTSDAEGAGILSSFAMFPDPNEVASVPDAAATPSERVNDTPPRRRTRPGSVSTGFAVQVAALGKDVTDISEYQARLNAVGQVYGKRESGVLRVRVGPYSDRKDAVAAQARVRSLGFVDAFVAKEAGGAAVGIDVAEVSPTPPAKVVPVATSAGAYLVRLATYGNFGNFDRSKAASLGTLTTRKRGEYTVVLVEGFADREAATAILEGAKAAGFADAHVVVESPDGTLKKVR